MPYRDKSDRDLVLQLAQMTRTFAKQRLELAKMEEEMKELSTEIARRLKSRPPEDDSN